MHPIFRDRGILSGYLTGWVPIGLMLAVVLHSSSQLNWTEVSAVILPVTILLAIVCLSAWYVCRPLDLKTTPDWRLALTFLLASMCASTVVMMLSHLWLWTLNHFFSGIEVRFRPGIHAMAGMFSIIYLLSIVLHYLILALESSQKAEILSREAEIKALKAQVNPHFLFNSLNSISALTSIDPAKARQMCVALSDFLRNSLRLGEQQSIPLGEELTLTKSYLDVERVRFGHKFRIGNTSKRAANIATCLLCWFSHLSRTQSSTGLPP